MVTREKIASIADSILATNKPYLVYKQFVDYYGEEPVDFQAAGEKSFSTVIDSIVTKYAEMEISDELLKTDIAEILRTNGFTANGKHILVKWPSVTVKNERDNEILLKEFYAKVYVTTAGHLDGYFYLNRADYPISHAVRGYMHSHVRGIPFDRPTEFQSSCLGNGPIRDTIATLNNTYDLDRWGLFCLELDRYVHVESLNGGPYHRMSEIRPLSAAEFVPLTFEGYTNRVSINWYRLSSDDVERVQRFLINVTPEFVKFLINSKILQFKFVNGAYAIAQPETDMLLAISDAFIDWYNVYRAAKGGPNYEQLLATEILFKTVMSEGNLFYRQSTSTSAARELQRYRGAYQGKTICHFKGNTVAINIHADAEDEIEVTENNQITVLNPSYVSYIVNRIVRFVNAKNVNNDSTNQSNCRLYSYISHSNGT